MAALIEELGNSDWVNVGIKYIHIDGEKGVCPFCQQETITQKFIDQLVLILMKAISTTN